MSDTQLADVQRVAEQILAEHAMELVECALHRHGNHALVRLLVDKVGGVTVQDCTRMNRVIGDALDAAQILGERYTLEVSSPGLDRPLTVRRDFERAIGEQVQLQLREPLAGDSKARTALEGSVLAVQEAAVVLTTASGNVTVPLASIQAAKKAIRW